VFDDSTAYLSYRSCCLLRDSELKIAKCKELDLASGITFLILCDVIFRCLRGLLGGMYVDSLGSSFNFHDLDFRLSQRNIPEEHRSKFSRCWILFIHLFIP
jgi:hypothetical protein